ncbi:uncharacterized protein A4U43_C07F28280 [Asparagus officinalis]|uniref:Uncharacterized protein n=1 Tax=Asparagus officinalis TaxID=4686 RepID=A0A5P1EJ64_ASPOF|nr:uncharacterized protein A4U43_C07F28280 [Asparagus officinalis]
MVGSEIDDEAVEFSIVFGFRFGWVRRENEDWGKFRERERDIKSSLENVKQVRPVHSLGTDAGTKPEPGNHLASNGKSPMHFSFSFGSCSQTRNPNASPSSSSSLLIHSSSRSKQLPRKRDRRLRSRFLAKISSRLDPQIRGLDSEFKSQF